MRGAAFGADERGRAHIGRSPAPLSSIHGGKKSCVLGAAFARRFEGVFGHFPGAKRQIQHPGRQGCAVLPFGAGGPIGGAGGKVQKTGGEAGIRTLVTVARKTAFEAAAFNHSATSPGNVACGCREGLCVCRGKSITDCRGGSPMPRARRGCGGCAESARARGRGPFTRACSRWECSRRRIRCRLRCMWPARARTRRRLMRCRRRR